MYTRKVIKNSLWLIVQPLILNIISLASTAYIARTLGQLDYGRFVFTINFIGLFLVLNHLGLRIIAVREIAENRNITSIFLSKMLPLRIVISILTVTVIFIAINLMNYSVYTKYCIYIFSLTIIFNSFVQTFNDCFQAHEKMEYIAWTQFISGAILTLLSVLVLLAGYRLIGLIAVYTFGSFIAVIVGMYYMKRITKIGLCFDFNFWKMSLSKGAPFYYPGLLGILGSKIGIVLLSKMSGEASVGIFGAASTITEKLAIIPDGVQSSFLPAMAPLYKESKEEASRLFGRIFTYLFMLGLPMAVGISILSSSIIWIIFGAGYNGASIILQILIWITFLSLFGSLCYSALIVLHQEKIIAIIGTTNTILFIMLSLYFIPLFKGAGLALANFVTALLYLAAILILIKKYLSLQLLSVRTFVRIVLANILMAICVYVAKNEFILVPIGLGIMSYALLMVWLKIITVEDVIKNYNQYVKPRFSMIRR